MIKRKASLGLDAVFEEKDEIKNLSITSPVQSKPKLFKTKIKKKQSIPVYVDPLLDEALQF